MVAAELYLHGAVVDTALEQADRKLVLFVIRDLVWKLYEQHENDPIVQIRKWGLRWTVRVKHVRPLLVRWFGAP